MSEIDDPQYEEGSETGFSGQKLADELAAEQGETEPAPAGSRTSRRSRTGKREEARQRNENSTPSSSEEVAPEPGQPETSEAPPVQEPPVSSESDAEPQKPTQYAKNQQNTAEATYEENIEVTRARVRTEAKAAEVKVESEAAKAVPKVSPEAVDMMSRAALARELGVTSVAEALPADMREHVVEAGKRHYEASNGEIRPAQTDVMNDAANLENQARDAREAINAIDDKSESLLRRLQRGRAERKEAKGEHKQLSELKEAYQDRKETRGELKTEDVEAAYAAHEANSAAVADAKDGRIEHARKMLELAHTRSNEAVKKYRDGKEAIPTEVDQMMEDVDEMLTAPKLDEHGQPIRSREITLHETPELNIRTLEAVKARFGISAEPMMTRAVAVYGDESEKELDREPGNDAHVEGVNVTELIYQVDRSTRLAYAERWSEDGQLLSARLVATEKSAFRERPVMSRLKRVTGLDRLNGLRPADETLNELSEAGADDVIPDWADYSDTKNLTPLTDRAKNKFKPVTQQLQSYGLDKESIDYITRRKKTNGRVRRRGIWATLRNR